MLVQTTLQITKHHDSDGTITNVDVVARQSDTVYSYTSTRASGFLTKASRTATLPSDDMTAQLGTLDRLPLELRQLIYKHMHADENGLHIGILPRDRGLEAWEIHPMLAQELYEYYHNTTKCEQRCTFYAGHFDPAWNHAFCMPTLALNDRHSRQSELVRDDRWEWTAWRTFSVARITELSIIIQHLSESDITASACMAQLEHIRNNISRLVDVMLGRVAQFRTMCICWDSPWNGSWYSVDVRELASEYCRVWRGPWDWLDDDADMAPLIAYILAPLMRLGGGVEESSHGASRLDCTALIEKLPLVMLDLSISLHE